MLKCISIVLQYNYIVDDEWTKISAGAKDLITKMLCKDMDKRLSAEEVMAHPWMQQDNQ